MEKMLAVVVGDESRAWEARQALKQLADQGCIRLHAQAVIGKNVDGRVEVKQSRQEVPFHAIGGTAVGALVGLLGGPVGFGIGAVTGGLAGSLRDFYEAEVSAEFADDISAALTPGRFAVIADIDEEWVTPIDTRLEHLGGIVFRTPRANFKKEHRARALTNLRAELARYRAELAQESSDRRAKLQAAIDRVKGRLHRLVAHAASAEDDEVKTAKHRTPGATCP